MGWLLASAVFWVAGTLVLLASTGDVARSSTLAGSTPIRIVSPEGEADSPTIVLAHGFSGSAAMMDPMASALARAGHVVVMPDLPGHGGNAAPLEDEALRAAVGDAVAAAAELTGRPVAVVGHSMGAGAVTAWAADNPTVATVGISLPDAADLPLDADRPRNLLVLWGSAESARFSDAALAALRAGYPDAEPGRTYGDPEQGTARRAVEVAGAEHISVIYRQQSFAEVAAWLGGGSPGATPGCSGSCSCWWEACWPPARCSSRPGEALSPAPVIRPQRASAARSSSSPVRLSPPGWVPPCCSR